MPPKETRPGQSGAADEPTCACVSDPFASLPPGGRSPTAALGVRRQEAPPPGGWRTGGLKQPWRPAPAWGEIHGSNLPIVAKYDHGF